MTAPETMIFMDEETREITRWEPPDWFVTLRASRHARVPFTEACGVPWGPYVEAWVLVSQSAEAEAEHKAHERAMRAAKRGR